MTRMKIVTMIRGALLAAIATAAVAASSDSGPAPEFALGALNGGKASLSQYKGQVVMINFWATWCGPCQQEMPLLDQMYKKYKGAGFTPPVKALLTKKPVSFPILLDPENKVSKIYRVNAMPSTVIVDRKGNVRYVHKGYKAGDENEYLDRIRGLIRE
jgi:thiol-disulfide isomerase/thioredoxin